VENISYSFPALVDCILVVHLLLQISMEDMAVIKLQSSRPQSYLLL